MYACIVPTRYLRCLHVDWDVLLLSFLIGQVPPMSHAVAHVVLIQRHHVSLEFLFTLNQIKGKLDMESLQTWRQGRS